LEQIKRSTSGGRRDKERKLSPHFILFEDALSRALSHSPNFAHFGAHPVTKTFLAITRRSDSIRKNGQSLNLFSEKRRVALTRCLGADFFTTWTQVKGKTVPFCD
jgi:hypothetical protein